MVSSFLPLRYVIAVVDRSMDEEPGVFTPRKFSERVREIGCAQWWVDQSVESFGDSENRVVTTLHAVVEPNPLLVAGNALLVQRKQWEITGEPEDFSQGFHGWDPGVVVVHCRKVEG